MYTIIRLEYWINDGACYVNVLTDEDTAITVKLTAEETKGLISLDTIQGIVDKHCEQTEDGTTAKAKQAEIADLDAKIAERKAELAKLG